MQPSFAKRRLQSVLFVVAAAIAAAPCTLADHHGEPAKAPAPSPEEQAMMEAYMKAGTPGPVHEEMARLAGSWKLEITSWPAPGAPPQTSAGTAEYELLYGGRYLKQTVRSEWAGQAFEGMGLEGYDNVLKERFGTWVDSMSTSIMVMRGKCPTGAKTCTFTGKMTDPLAGKSVDAREVVTHVDANKFIFAMYGPDAKGKEFKSMEIVYTRP
jgi:hypothetical protein